MGLIDRMLADMVGKSTGLNPRMVRKLIRGKGSSLLMMGGAAALGAALADQKRSAAAQGPTAPPPSTPPPSTPRAGAVPPPPSTLPPVPMGASPAPSASAPAVPPIPAPPAHAGPAPTADGDDASDLPPAATLPIVRAMVAAALADGSLGDAERDAIHRHLASGDLTGEQVGVVHRELVIPASPSSLAAAADDAASETGLEAQGLREAMFRLAGAVILADGDVADAERAWLASLADALGFDAEHRLRLEAEIFDHEV